jgi:uncharacterized protein YpmB
MSTALPGSGGTATIKPPPGANPVRIVMTVVVLLIVIGLIWKVFHQENQYEKIARAMTLALQKNDIAAVDKFQNAETATHVTRAIVGHDADVFVPLGDLKNVHETGSEDRVHEFDVTFDKGVVHETVQFDPDNKVVHFRFDPPIKK